MLDLFNKISQTGSPALKVHLLKSYPFQGELKDILRFATDPFITFGITDFDLPPFAPAITTSPEAVLTMLANRTFTGGEARKALGIALSGYDGTIQEVYRRVLRKDLRCGLGEKLILEAYPGLFRTFEVMRAKKFDKLGKGTYYIEPKYDGLRCIANVQGTGVTLLSRNGLPFTSSDHLKSQILELVDGWGDCVLDGELTSGNFNESSSAVRRKDQQNDSTDFIIFDFMSQDEWNHPTKPYTIRRRELLALNWEFKANLMHPPSYAVHNEEEIIRYYNLFLDRGLEGGMIKKGDGLYRFTRHKDWMKMKEINDVDLICEGLVQGEGKYHGMLGALIFKYKGKRISVGGGMSDEERALWWKDPSLIKGKVCEIHYHQVTPDGSLRHPRLHCVRWDKS